MEHAHSLGDRLLGLRMDEHLTQQQLADELGVTKGTVCHWERDFSVPATPVITRLAARFGVTTDYLLRGDDKTA